MKVILFALALILVPNAEKTVPEIDQEVSVSVETQEAYGSGVVFTREGTSFVWTAAHVVATARHVRNVDSGDGKPKEVVTFDPVEVSKQISIGGRTAFRAAYVAYVIKYSEIGTGQDLALLRVETPNAFPTSARFYLDSAIPKVGTPLYHVGSMGQWPESVTTGVQSFSGRIMDGLVFDQTSAPALPGSSGGGVFLEDGRVIGIFARQSSPALSFYIPLRRIKAWAEENNLMWALDPSVPMPLMLNLTGGR